MSLTDARKRANAKYLAKAYDSVSIRWPREFCEQLRRAADQSGESLAGYVRKAIEQRMQADGVQPTEEPTTTEP